MLRRVVAVCNVAVYQKSSSRIGRRLSFSNTRCLQSRTVQSFHIAPAFSTIRYFSLHGLIANPSTIGTETAAAAAAATTTTTCDKHSLKNSSDQTAQNKIVSDKPLVATASSVVIDDLVRQKQHQRHENNLFLLFPNIDDARKIVHEMCRVVPKKDWDSFHESVARMLTNSEKVNKLVPFKGTDFILPKSIPKWVRKNIVTLLENRNQESRKYIEQPVKKTEIEETIQLLMRAREASTKQPLFWSRAQRVKILKKIKIPNTKNDDDDGDDIHPSEGDDESDDEESSHRKEQGQNMPELHDKKTKTEKRWDAQKLAYHLKNNLPPEQLENTAQIFKHLVDWYTVTCLEQLLRDYGKLNFPRVAKEMARFFYYLMDEDDNEEEFERLINKEQLYSDIEGEPVELTAIELTSHADVLMKCREATVKSGLTWALPGPHITAEELVESRKRHAEKQEKARTVHATKDEATNRKEAMEIVQHLALNLSVQEFEDVLHQIQCFDPKSPKAKKANVRFLGQHLAVAATTHVHLVAKEVAAFFYLKVDEQFINRYENLRHAKEQFDADMEPIVDSLYKVQAVFFQLDNRLKFEDMDDQVDVMIKPTKISHNNSYRPRIYHIVMDAIMTTQEPVLVPGSDRMVFVDNLPIDMTELQLRKLYSRCGPVESVMIFNQRPDLDPGELTPEQILDAQKKIRTNLQNYESNYFERARTPVYAVITFESAEGYNVCIDPNLCLFGIIIERHAVRSCRASNLTKLFIENIPFSWTSRDLEHEINGCLNPMLKVYLDLGVNTRKFGTSCEINFPSFEVTFESHRILNEKLKLTSRGKSKTVQEPVTINFWKNPRDAKKYWTRQLGFF